MVFKETDGYPPAFLQEDTGMKEEVRLEYTQR